jgi:site-specific DNA recombinase
MGQGEIASVVQALADLITVVRAASPADQAQIYIGLGLRLTYQPGRQLVRIEVPGGGAGFGPVG